MGLRFRRALAWSFVVNAAFLAVLGVSLLASGLSGIDRLPQLVVAVTLLLALIAVMPLRFGEGVARGPFGWAVGRPLARRWV
ncbi:MAG: hypothetical protein R3F59_38000, partial [Myxococcota bacterium]